MGDSTVPSQQSAAAAQAPIDALSGVDAMSVMLASHMAALDAMRDALAEIEQAAALVAAAFEAGHVVHYAAAGSSGLMALADACELPGTFQIPQAQIRICMAGGVPADGHMPGHTEDREDDGRAAASAVAPGDVALVISASGTTPYALGFARAASAQGAKLVGIANFAGSELLGMSDIAIALNSGKEVLEGSTRLGAGTAQKVALNMISTRVGVLMGHVHDGMMVNLSPENIKLRKRAQTIVSRIAGVSPAAAQQALERTGYDTKRAVLVAAGLEVSDAEKRLARHHGHLRACLQDIT